MPDSWRCRFYPFKGKEETLNGAPITCNVTVQAARTKYRVRWCLETSRTRVVQRKVSTREKGKSRTVFSIVNLLLIYPIYSSFNYIEIQTCIVTICSPLIAFYCRGSASLVDIVYLCQPMNSVLLLHHNITC